VFERFTELAKRAVVLAQDSAIAQSHDHIGTEHMLIGLAGVRRTFAGDLLHDKGLTPKVLTEEATRVLDAAGFTPTPPQAATEALAAIGIDVEEIRRKADESFGPGKFHFPRPAFTPRAKKVLGLIAREAHQLGSERIDTEHMLLGLLAEGEGTAIAVLRNLDVDVAALRAEVLARIGK
jgi:ATP-dependent Clp protease ATP-binding subunit ClpC